MNKKSINIFCKKNNSPSKGFFNPFWLIGFFMFFCPSSLFAQEQLNLAPIDEAQYAEEQVYFANYRDSLPFYFFTYCQGGATQNERVLPIEVMQARRWVVPFPVIITEELGKGQFEQWKEALIYAKNKGIEFKSPAEKEAFVANMNKPEFKSYYTPQELIKFKMNSRPEGSAEVLPESTNSEANKELKETGKKSSKKGKDDSTINAPQNLNYTYNPIPYSIKEKMFEMDEEAAWKWLFTQQVVAGNVIYCKAGANIPFALNVTDQAERNKYLNVLKLWKKAYPITIDKTNIPLVKELKKDDLDLFITEFGKNNVLSPTLKKNCDANYLQLKNNINSLNN